MAVDFTGLGCVGKSSHSLHTFTSVVSPSCLCHTTRIQSMHVFKVWASSFLPTFISFAASVAELAHGEKSRTLSLTQSITHSLTQFIAVCCALDQMKLSQILPCVGSRAVRIELTHFPGRMQIVLLAMAVFFVSLVFMVYVVVMFYFLVFWLSVPVQFAPPPYLQ